MSKERLEEIDQIVSDLSNDEIEIREFVNKHFEQVQELEAQLQASNNVRQRLKQRIDELESSKFIAASMRLAEQNKRYRKVIQESNVIFAEAIESIDLDEEVQGLEYGIKITSQALEESE